MPRPLPVLRHMPRGRDFSHDGHIRECRGQDRDGMRRGWFRYAGPHEPEEAVCPAGQVEEER